MKILFGGFNTLAKLDPRKRQTNNGLRDRGFSRKWVQAGSWNATDVFVFESLSASVKSHLCNFSSSIFVFHLWHIFKCHRWTLCN